MKTCKDCRYFIGMGDWDLCCLNPPASAKESWCGFLCYEDTEACENFNTINRSDWVSCVECACFEDCEAKESRDGCYFGEVENND